MTVYLQSAANTFIYGKNSKHFNWFESFRQLKANKWKPYRGDANGMIGNILDIDIAVALK